MDLGLTGRKALVTGASKGIGAAVAGLFAAEGADVAICARTGAELDRQAEALAAQGATVHARALDVADGEALQSWIRDAADELGGLDVVVHNVSAAVPMTPPEEAWRTSFTTDVLALVRTLDAALPHLSRSDASALVTLGTTAALERFGLNANSYAAMKAAAVQHTLDQAARLAATGVRANVVSPGPVWVAGGQWDTVKQLMPPLYEQVLAECPMGRLATPEEVARAVVFLASPAASYITGAHVVVDGGFTRRLQW